MIMMDRMQQLSHHYRHNYFLDIFARGNQAKLNGSYIFTTDYCAAGDF